MATRMSSTDAFDGNLSRVDTLQKLLASHGAPGSSGGGELVTCPEYVPALHPHLIPLMKSETSGNYICALNRVYDDVSAAGGIPPMPIVESAENMPGMRLLALNSEHLMRRIACEADDSGTKEGKDIVAMYNNGLGSGLVDEAFDSVYEHGSVEKLGYGLDKYILLRVGPFPDLYETMSCEHMGRNSEESALIAAETANGKFTGFGSSFASYARLLNSLPNRNEEARDAARVCLRLPLYTMGMTVEEFAEISRLAELAGGGASVAEALKEVESMYEKIRKSEAEADKTQSGKTDEQRALDEANYILDSTALNGARWEGIRGDLCGIYERAGKETMATFVNPPVDSSFQ